MTTTDASPTGADREPSGATPTTFADELSRLKIKRGDTEPERILVFVGLALFMIGILLIVFSLQTAHTTADPLVQNERIILSVLGALLGLSGVVIWARYSLTRYFRYWLIRGIFAGRLPPAQTNQGP